MTVSTENFNKVHRYFTDNNLWDDVYVDFAEDHEGNQYAIVESNEDEDKFIKYSMEALEIENGDIEDLLDIEIVYSDEYTTCSDCQNIIRTSPTSYHWQPDFFLGDGFIACNVCFNKQEDYQEKYIEERINDPKEAVNGMLSEKQLQELGFKKYNQESFEHGLHNGQTDNPNEIYNELSVLYYDVLFVVDEVSQFYITFSVWVRGEI